jgi:hypothetical protein
MLGKTRTFNRWIRSPVLYPIELQAREGIIQALSLSYPLFLTPKEKQNYVRTGILAEVKVNNFSSREIARKRKFTSTR